MLDHIFGEDKTILFIRYKVNKTCDHGLRFSDSIIVSRDCTVKC